MNERIIMDSEEYIVEGEGLFRNVENKILYKQERSEISGTPILAPQIEIVPQEDNYPLQRYGKQLMKYMEENHEDRYWELITQGLLMKKLHEREEQLKDMKISLMEQIEKKNPRPITDDFFKVVQHMEWIQSQAEEMVREELYKPI